jgi:two-component system, NtrC family, sensor histidine kinase HydH
MSASRNLVGQVDGVFSVTPSAARAHAIKNCLSVVRAINRLIEPEVREETRQRLERSQAAVSRVLELLEADLVPRTMGRVGEGAFLRADQVIDAVIERVADRGSEAGVTLVADCGQGGVFCDPASMIEALQNLVANAIEASAFGSAVVVKTQELGDGSQALSITDRGSGVPGDVLARLGTPFLTSRKGGSGLGFAVARNVIEQHGGTIRIESAANVGTTVSVWLPAPPGDRRTAAESVLLAAGQVGG